MARSGDGNEKFVIILFNERSCSFRIELIQVLREGSYLAKLYPARKPDGPPITVRVIEYTVHTTATNGGTEETSEVFALVTDLLDSEAYPMRWGCETVIGRHKTDMGAGMPVLRSKDPEGVAQEMWATFAVYQAIHTLIGAAVDASGIPPDAISFPNALAAVADTVTAGFPPHQLDLALATFLLKILDPASLVRDRPHRTNPQATKKAGDFPARKDKPSVTHITRRIQLHALRPRPSG